MRTEEVPGSCDAATARMVDDLFARSEEFTGFSQLADISQAPSFHTKVVGVTFDGRQEGLVGLEQGEELLLVREPDNPHHPGAIAVLRAGGVRIGYLKRLIAAAIAPEIDRGANYGAVVSGLTGGTAEKASRGVNILVMRQGRPGSADALTVVERRHAERARRVGASGPPPHRRAARAAHRSGRACFCPPRPAPWTTSTAASPRCA